MKTTILRCDRCKKETGELIEFSFVNRNEEIKEDTESDATLDSFSAAFFGSRKQFPTVSGELCYDCVKEISRWLGHQENCLTGRM